MRRRHSMPHSGSSKPHLKSPWIKRLAAAFGLLLLVVLLAHFDWQLVLTEILGLHPVWGILAAVSIALSSVLGALNIYWLILPRPDFSFGEFVPVFWTGWAVGLVVPGQVGEVASISVMLHRRGVRVQTSLGLLLLDKAISLFVMMLYGCVGIWSVSIVISLGGLPLTLTASFTAAALLAFLTLRYLAPQSRSTQWIRQIWATARFTVVRHPRIVLRNFAVTVVKVALMGLAYYFMFGGLGASQIGPVEIVGLAMAAGLVAYLPISFNGIGTVELAGVFLFSQGGVEPTTTLAAYLLLRIMTLILAWLPALIWIALARQTEPASAGVNDERSDGKASKSGS